MSVFGTPENPNPPTKTVVSDFISDMASCAEETILLIAGRAVVVEKKRGVMALRRAEKSICRCIVFVVEIVNGTVRKGHNVRARELRASSGVSRTFRTSWSM
jgi:hypothetical protein